jgi:hypothetical protein
MDIRAVDLNLLKAFDALTNERADRAAERIGLSQPAMSHALSRLRSLLPTICSCAPRPAWSRPPAREIPLVAAAIEHIEAALNLGIGFDPAKSTASSPPAWLNMPSRAGRRLAAAFAGRPPGRRCG